MGRVTYNPSETSISTQIMRKGGDVDGAILRRAVRVSERAKTEVPNTSGRGTGELARSIHVERTRAERGRFGFGYKVVADAPHAAAVHAGSSAHFIRADPTLAFNWAQKGGQRFVILRAGNPRFVNEKNGVIFVRGKGGVDIPARKGNPYMTRALRAVR